MIKGIIDYLSTLTAEEKEALNKQHTQEQKKKYVNLIESFQRIRNRKLIHGDVVKKNNKPVFLLTNIQQFKKSNIIPKINSIDELQKYISIDVSIIRCKIPKLLDNGSIIQELEDTEQITVNMPLEVVTGLTQLGGTLLKTTLHDREYTCNNHYVLVYWVWGQLAEKWAFVINSDAQILSLEDSIALLESYNNEYYLSNI